jgi:hypothetical protein
MLDNSEKIYLAKLVGGFIKQLIIEPNEKFSAKHYGGKKFTDEGMDLLGIFSAIHMDYLNPTFSLIDKGEKTIVFHLNDDKSTLTCFIEKPEFVCGCCSNKAKMTCSRCKTARYCSQECQKHSWSDHKKSCKQI